MTFIDTLVRINVLQQEENKCSGGRRNAEEALGDDSEIHGYIQVNVDS